jgi:hypothetical protein
MGYRKQDRFQKIPKSQRAKQFEEGLLDQMRFEPEINNLWIKYRFDITLPVNDNERVEFNRDDSTGDFKKLKDFILLYEENWMLE